MRIKKHCASAYLTCLQEGSIIFECKVFNGNWQIDIIKNFIKVPIDYLIELPWNTVGIKDSYFSQVYVWFKKCQL